MPTSIGVVGSHKVVGNSNSKNFIWSIQVPHITECSYVHQCSVSLASLMAISCQLSAWPGKLKLYKCHASTCGHLRVPWMRPEYKQIIELLAMLYTWTVIICCIVHKYMLNGGDQWDLKLCVYKTPVGKSSYIHMVQLNSNLKLACIEMPFDISESHTLYIQNHMIFEIFKPGVCGHRSCTPGFLKLL